MVIGSPAGLTGEPLAVPSFGPGRPSGSEVHSPNPDECHLVWAPQTSRGPALATAFPDRDTAFRRFPEREERLFLSGWSVCGHE